MNRSHKVSPLTRAVERAHENILRAYGIVDRKHAQIPLMHEQIDPRTAKKYAEYAGSNPLAGSKQVSDPAPIEQKERKPSRPIAGSPKNLQSEKNRSGGYPIDPASLETATVGRVDSPGPASTMD